MSTIDTELALNGLITDLLAVLYEHGIKEVNMGGLLRLLGVSNDIASLQDDDIVVITESFAKYMNQLNQLSSEDGANQIVH